MMKVTKSNHASENISKNSPPSAGRTQLSKMFQISFVSIGCMLGYQKCFKYFLKLECQKCSERFKRSARLERLFECQKWYICLVRLDCQKCSKYFVRLECRKFFNYFAWLHFLLEWKNCFKYFVRLEFQECLKYFARLDWLNC